MVDVDMTAAAQTPAYGPGEVQLPCADLTPSLEFFIGRLGFRIETIFPADDPQVAVISGHGLRLRLAPGDGDAGCIRLESGRLSVKDDQTLTAPNGTRIEFVDPDPPIDIPPLRAEFVLTRAKTGPQPGEGRAGMIYRDLIPGRLGGRYIASHIAVPDGGPLADWVHFHKIRFQLIFCRRGWARLVYEDQGPPFLMQAGDCVLQPPRIRHRVLETSPGFEVVELGCPALHETLADHEMALPTGRTLPDQDYSGQVFLHHIATQTPWLAHGDSGFERRETGLAVATRGLADAKVFRPAGVNSLSVPAHDGDLLFGFLLEGSAELERGGDHPLRATDAFVIPAGERWGLRDCSEEFQLLEISAPES